MDLFGGTAESTFAGEVITAGEFTGAYVAKWLGLAEALTVPGHRVADLLGDVVAAVIAHAGHRCHLPAIYPADLTLALTMQAARLYERSRTPSGIADFGEVGIVRLSRFDADVETLLGPYLKLDGFC